MKIDEQKEQQYWENLAEFENESQVPYLPVPLTPFHIEMLIKAGAIPKKDLKHGARYVGKCRNAREGIWLADKNIFLIERVSYGCTFSEDIHHFEDDDGYDLFVPIREMKYGRVV